MTSALTPIDSRTLVSIEYISEIRPIQDADKIETAVIKGWTVVVLKGEFFPGDPVVFFEVDSLLPLDDSRFAFLAPRGEKIVDGVRYHRLKTARLRGVYSQGLAIPTSHFLPEELNAPSIQDALGVIKYVPPIPTDVGNIIGEFRTELARQTDSERIQNLVGIYDVLRAAGPWVASEKIDGTSVTIARTEDGLHVFSRNWEIEDGDNIYWDAARQLLGPNLDEHLEVGEAIQGEIYGQGIQGNPLKIEGRRCAIFAFTRDRKFIPDMNKTPDGQKVPDSNRWPRWTRFLSVKGWGLMELPATVEELIDWVDGLTSTINSNCLAEGVVFHRANMEGLPELDYRHTFKVVSRKYLVRHDG